MQQVAAGRFWSVLSFRHCTVTAVHLTGHRMLCFFRLMEKTPFLWECGFHGGMYF